MALHMTGKNYTAIAAVIRRNVEAHECDDQIIDVLADVAAGIADHCEQDFYLFDRAAFYESCGIGLTEQ